nr:MAG TPA: hypothetical protein [Caudoviricetes sp.]
MRKGKKYCPVVGTGQRFHYLTRIVLVVVLDECPLLTVVRTRTFPLLVVRAVELTRIRIVRPISDPPFS